jgi:hypothetical protein
MAGWRSADVSVADLRATRVASDDPPVEPESSHGEIAIHRPIGWLSSLTGRVASPNAMTAHVTTNAGLPHT